MFSCSKLKSYGQNKIVWPSRFLHEGFPLAKMSPFFQNFQILQMLEPRAQSNGYKSVV